MDLGFGHIHTVCVTIVGNMAISYCCNCGTILDVKKIEEEPYQLTGTISGINSFTCNEYEVPDEINKKPQDDWETLFLNKLDDKLRELIKESQKNHEKSKK